MVEIYEINRHFLDIVVEVSEDVGIDVLFEGNVTSKKYISKERLGMVSLVVSQQEGSNLHRRGAKIFAPLLIRREILREKLPNVLKKAQEEARKAELPVPCWKDKMENVPTFPFFHESLSHDRFCVIFDKLVYKGHKFLLAFDTCPPNHTIHHPVVKFPYSSFFGMGDKKISLPRYTGEPLYVCLGGMAMWFDCLICDMKIEEASMFLKLFLCQPMNQRQ